MQTQATSHKHSSQCKVYQQVPQEHLISFSGLGLVGKIEFIMYILYVIYVTYMLYVYIYYIIYNIYAQVE